MAWKRHNRAWYSQGRCSTRKRDRQPRSSLLTMAKTRGVDAKLARLQALKKEPFSPAITAELRKFLGDASNFVVADAATIAGEKNLVELASDLAAAFDRFLIDSEETDKLCRAKLAILEAL